MANPTKWKDEGRDFDFERDTPFYEERSYGHRVGNGDESYYEDTYSEEEKTNWLLDN